MPVGILAAVAAYLLVSIYAAPTNDLHHSVGLKARQLVATTDDHGAVLAQHGQASSWRVDAVRSSTKTRSGLLRSAFGAQADKIRPRSKRAAIVNGFTSWDYEPFDKMGAFRTGRGDYEALLHDRTFAVPYVITFSCDCELL